VVGSDAPVARSCGQAASDDLAHRSREAFRLAGASLAGVDGKGRIVSVNPAFERLVGLDAAAILGRPLSDLWGVDFVEEGGDDHGLLQAGGAIHVEAVPVPGAGVPPCSLRVVQLTDRLGSQIRFGLQAERLDASGDRYELSAGEKGLRLSFDQLVVGMATILMDGRMSAVNRAFCDIVGREAAEFDRLDVFSIVHPDDRREDLERGMLVYAGENDGWTREKRLLRNDGSEVWVLETAARMRTPPATSRRRCRFGRTSRT
jgi:PAS domain S-box-containing protein